MGTIIKNYLKKISGKNMGTTTNKKNVTIKFVRNMWEP